MSKSYKLSLAFLATAAVALLAVAARWDLALDRALYAPTDPFAIWMEAFCWWPIYLPFVLLGALWVARPRPAQRAAGAALALLTGAALVGVAVRYLYRRGFGVGFLGLWGIAGAAALAAGFFAAAKAGPGVRARLSFLAQAGIALCLAETVTINLLKMLWSRMRFDDMLAAGDFGPFTPFWQWGSVAGNTSFPSGHTAAACGVLALLLLPALFRRFAGRQTPLLWLCACWLALTGFARMRIGRHFLSDTVAAVVVVALVWAILCATPVFRRGLQRAQRAKRDF